MTREEFKKIVFEASKNDKGSPKNCIHLLSLHVHIEKLFSTFKEKEDLHKTHIDELRNAIERYMDMSAMYKNLFEKSELRLKDKDEEIELWKAEFRRMQDIAINKDVTLYKAFEEIKELKE